jgi:hypothetical protein
MKLAISLTTVITTLAPTLSLTLSGSAHANNFIGWCFVGDCVGQAPITKDGFFTCEENCSMNNPISVRGLNATLYDVVCTGDSNSYQQRMLFMKYKDDQGNEKAMTLSPTGVNELQRCE